MKKNKVIYSNNGKIIQNLLFLIRFIKNYSPKTKQAEKIISDSLKAKSGLELDKTSDTAQQIKSEKRIQEFIDGCKVGRREALGEVLKLIDDLKYNSNDLLEYKKRIKSQIKKEMKG